MEHPLLDSEHGFAVDGDALNLGVQQELADAQEVTESREPEGILPREGRRDGTQQDFWPSASSARQMQPSASSLA